MPADLERKLKKMAKKKGFGKKRAGAYIYGTLAKIKKAKKMKRAKSKYKVF